MLQQQQLNPRRYDALVVFVVIIWIVAMLSSCATQKKAEKFYKKHPIELAKQCAEKFPIREQYIKGDTVTNYDTLWGIETITDTLISEPQVITEVRTVTVPKIITKTNTIRDTVVMENTAKSYVLSAEIRKLITDKEGLEVKLSAVTEARDKWRKRFFILLGLVVVYFGIKYRKLIKL